MKGRLRLIVWVVVGLIVVVSQDSRLLRDWILKWKKMIKYYLVHNLINIEKKTGTR